MLPHFTGGEALEAVSTAATEAAVVASTGAWLAQLESGVPVKTAAPGLSRGLFGAWAEPDAPPAASPSNQETSIDAEGGTTTGNHAARDKGGVSLDGGGAIRGEGSQKVQLDDLFSGIWLAEDEEEGGNGSSTDGDAVPVAVDGVLHPGVLAQLAALPDEADVPGAVTSAAGTCWDHPPPLI